MKKSLLVCSAQLFTLLVISVAPVLTTTLSAEELKLEVTDASALKMALEKLTGKSVVLRLTSGEDVSGVLEAVGPTTVRVGQLSGKEFYSAVVVLDRVSAVIYRSK